MLDWYTWNTILPKGAERIAAGYAGAKVRVLQSALRVYGYNCPVTSRFGTETVRSLREFQKDNSLRTTGRAGQTEWIILFDYH
jgi:peptidoglycan hydrolase-like protein with peptidoglycan-binding domain